MEAINTHYVFFPCREITKPLRPLGKAASLLMEILGLLCKSMVSESLLGVMCRDFSSHHAVLAGCYDPDASGPLVGWGLMVMVVLCWYLGKKASGLALSDQFLS